MGTTNPRFNLSRNSSKNTNLLLEVVKNYWMIIATFVMFLFKSMFFVMLISSDTASVIDISKIGQNFETNLLYCAFIVVILAFAFLFKKRGQILYLIIVNVLFTVLIIFDLWYYRGFATFLSPNLLKQTSNLDNLSDSIISMARPVDIIFIVDIVIFTVLSFFKNISYKNANKSIIAFLILLATSLGFIEVEHYKADIVHKGFVGQTIFKTCWTPTITMNHLSPLGYHVFDFYNFVQLSQKFVLNSDQKKDISNWYRDNKEVLPDNEFKGRFKGKNLLVLQIESLENFVINKKINGKEITPNINSLLKNSLYFTNYNEEVNSGTSSDADLMTNTSIYPIRQGSTFFQYPSNKYNSMPHILNNEGYNTLAIHPDKGAYWNWMPSLKSMEFNKCIDYSYFKHDEFIGLGLSDGSYFRQVEPIIKQEKQPFYTFVVTLTSHSPFDLPAKYRELGLDSNLNKSKLGGYFESVHYADKQIGSFIAKLKADGLLDNTVIALYGDHCGIHKYFQDEVNNMKPSQDWWVDNKKQIPLIIYNPSQKGETIDTIGGQIDLMPTLLYLMGVDQNKYINTAMGRNLLNTKESYALWSNREVVGTPSSAKKKDEVIKGLDIADEIIRSNYYKGY